MDWAKAIRSAAKRKGQTLEQFRRAAGIPNGSFYNLLSGRKPGVTRNIIRLIDAGVSVPDSVRRVLAA